MAGPSPRLVTCGTPLCFVDEALVKPMHEAAHHAQLKSVHSGRGVLQSRSVARLGDSDFGVNGKQLAALKDQLKG